MFLTVCDPSGTIVEFGSRDVSLLYRRCRHADRLAARIAAAPNHWKRYSLRRVQLWLFQNMCDLTWDMRSCLARRCFSNCDVVLLPKFETLGASADLVQGGAVLATGGALPLPAAASPKGAGILHTGAACGRQLYLQDRRPARRAATHVPRAEDFLLSSLWSVGGTRLERSTEHPPDEHWALSACLPVPGLSGPGPLGSVYLTPAMQHG